MQDNTASDRLALPKLIFPFCFLLHGILTVLSEIVNLSLHCFNCGAGVWNMETLLAAPYVCRGGSKKDDSAAWS